MPTAANAVTVQPPDSYDRDLAETAYLADKTDGAEMPMLVRQLDTILGSQPLTDRGQMRVQPSLIPDLSYFGVLTAANADIIVPCAGMATVAFDTLTGWTGTLSFEGTVDGLNWRAVTLQSVLVLGNGQTVEGVATSSAGVAMRGSIAGFAMFRVRFSTFTTGPCRITVRTSAAPFYGRNPAIIGSVGLPFSQRGDLQITANAAQLQVYSSGLDKDAFTLIEPWNTKAFYNVGDTVLYAGQVYQCIVAHTATTATSTLLAGNANWQVDPRGRRDLATITPISPPTAPRMRVEIDLDEYQIGLAEQTLIAIRQYAQDQMLREDYLSVLTDYGVNGGLGQQGRVLANGLSTSGVYDMEEIR